jgi:hypothetical protein
MSFTGIGNVETFDAFSAKAFFDEFRGKKYF